MLKRFLRRSWAKLYTHNTCISATCSQRLLCQPPLLHTGEGMWMHNLKLPLERVWKSLCVCAYVRLCHGSGPYSNDCKQKHSISAKTPLCWSSWGVWPLRSSLNLISASVKGTACVSMWDSWLYTPMLCTHTHIQLHVPFTHTNSRSAVSELPEPSVCN